MRTLGGYLSHPCSNLEGLPRLVITLPRLPGQTPHSWPPVHTRLYFLCMPSCLATGCPACPACPLESPQTPLHTHAPGHWLCSPYRHCMLQAACLHHLPHSPCMPTALTTSCSSPVPIYSWSQEIASCFPRTMDQLWLATSALLCHLVGCTMKEGQK